MNSYVTAPQHENLAVNLSEEPWPKSPQGAEMVSMSFRWFLQFFEMWLAAQDVQPNPPNFTRQIGGTLTEAVMDELLEVEAKLNENPEDVEEMDRLVNRPWGADGIWIKNV